MPGNVGTSITSLIQTPNLTLMKEIEPVLLNLTFEKTCA